MLGHAACNRRERREASRHQGKEQRPAALSSKRCVIAGSREPKPCNRGCESFRFEQWQGSSRSRSDTINVLDTIRQFACSVCVDTCHVDNMYVRSYICIHTPTLSTVYLSFCLLT